MEYSSLFDYRHRAINESMADGIRKVVAESVNVITLKKSPVPNSSIKFQSN